MKKWKMKRNGALAAAVMMMAGSLAVPVQAEGDFFGGAGSGVEQLTPPASFAGTQKDVVALDDLGISVAVSGYKSIAQEDGFVYIYTLYSDSMPYVILGRYEGESEDIAGEFTDFLGESYEDLSIVEEAMNVTIDGREFTEIRYTYTACGYTINDTRLFNVWNGNTYMFGAKTVPALNYLMEEGYLEGIAASYAPLAGGYDDYEKHVDSEQSVTGEEQELIGDLGGGAGDVAGDTGGEGQIGAGGGVGSVSDIGQTGSDTGKGRIVFDESNAVFAGTWLEFEDGFRLYLPSQWQEFTVTDEQRQQGLLYVAGDGSGSENAPYLSVCWTSSDGYTTLEEIAAELTSGGYSVDDLVTINDIDCVAYTSVADNVSGVMFFHPFSSDYVFAVVGAPYTQNVDVIASILCSLSRN